MKVLLVVGARPNFMKVAPLMAEMARHADCIEQVLVHSGQHYDANMSDVFFEDLGLPKPDVYLGVGSGSHAVQTAKVMLAFEPVLLEQKPDWVVVVGDVNSTLACALVAAKLGIRVAHVEAGLRSFDPTMPEEINRILTDKLSDLLFTTEESANENLRREGICTDKIRFVGNVMIDTLVRLQPQAESRWPALRATLSLQRYVLVTLHRPSNVDDATNLSQIMRALPEIASDLQVIFPVHPRTRKMIDADQLNLDGAAPRLLDPLGYLDFLCLMSHADLVITDSGGVQEETAYLGIPCLTVRPNTERPITLTLGTNRLVESTTSALIEAARAALHDKPGECAVLPLWDGYAARRIVDILITENGAMGRG